MTPNRSMSTVLLASIILMSLVSYPVMAQNRALTFQDVMQFKSIRSVVISHDGAWAAFSAQPDRGDGEVIVRATEGKGVFTLPRGDKPVFSADGRWVVAELLPDAAAVVKAEKSKDKPKKGMTLLDVHSGDVVRVDSVEAYAISEDSRWLMYTLSDRKTGDKKKDDKSKRPVGKEAVLRCLDTGVETRIPFVHSFAFDSTGRYLTYATADTSGAGNGLYAVPLSKTDLIPQPVDTASNSFVSNLSWNNRRGALAYLSSSLTEKGKPEASVLRIWDPSNDLTNNILSPESAPDGWFIPEKNGLTWTQDGDRLFFGLKPTSDILPDDTEPFSDDESEEDVPIDLFDTETILSGRTLDVWHWNDPFIIPHQKKQWDSEKDRFYRAVYHADSERIVQLSDKTMPDVQIAQNPSVTLGTSDLPYRKRMTWDGSYADVFLVNLHDGSRTPVTTELGSRATLSPGGKYVVFWDDCHWHLFDAETGLTRNLTESLNVPFFDEDHDYPEDVPGYGIGGWLEDDRAVLIYDKYDVWQFDTRSGDALNITSGDGRKTDRTFRVIDTDPDRPFFRDGEQLLLSSYHNHDKSYGFYRAAVDKQGVRQLLEAPKRFRYLAKARDKDRILFTQESYTEFPDIWTSNTNLRSPRKLTNVNPQIADFAWGDAELVEWRSVDGIPLQGVLIKPGNYEPGKRYPVLVYYYRFFSQRLHEFNAMAVNHRPNFPFYASNGYAVFLPDVRFEIGRPGFSATKCVVPGVQKLVDIGIADPNGVALHGHSWSGYQTAFVITQTNFFACAVAGAPVSNMTSAYSGIRLGSGLARQFQYEKTQSRIGGSLWEFPERYIENSPVFFADKIETPLLIMFGDMDDAVPWHQGVELHLAMRRLGKDCVFLQYRDEPHHPQKYANKLDYSIKMKEYIDHYCKGTPAPAWMTEGVPYRGK